MSVWFRRLCVAVSGLLALCVSVSADAQSFYSHRVRALGLDLAGVIVDPVTDAYLNPSRLTSIEGKRLTFARHESRGFSTQYPGIHTWRWSNAEVVPPETYSSTAFGSLVSTSPFEITFTGPISVGTITLGLDVGYDEWENLDHDNSQSVYNDELLFRSETSARQDRDLNVRFVAGVGIGDPDARGFGARIVLQRSNGDHGDVRIRDSIYLFPMTSDLTSDYRFERRTGNLEATRVQLTAGVHRPGNVLRGIVLGAGYSRQVYPMGFLTVESRDEDEDGDGQGPFGGSPSYSIDRTEYDAGRTYDGPTVNGRIHADLSESVTLIAGASFSERSGSGTGRYSVLKEDGPNALLRTTDNVLFNIEGTDREYAVRLGLAHRNARLTDNVSVWFGGFASFARTNFWEDGEGTIELLIDDQGTQPVIIGGRFSRRALRLVDVVKLRLPFATEWRPNRHIAFRLGATITASRTEDERTVRGSVIDAQLPDAYVGARHDTRRTISADVSLDGTNGVGVYFGENDRLSIDLYNQFDGVDLSSFSYFSIGYRFD